MRAIVEADELLYRVAFSHEKQAYIVKYRDGSPDEDAGCLSQTEIKKELFDDGLYIERDYTLHGYKVIEEDFNLVAKDLEDRINDLYALSIEVSKGRLEPVNSIELWLSPSDHSNFRYKIVEIAGSSGLGYKVNRLLRPKPIHLSALRDLMITKYKAKEAKGFEADDALGWESADDTVLVHQDKDIDMIPGWHYNPITKETYRVEEGLGTLKLIIKTSKKGEKSYKLVGRGLIQFYAQLLLGDSTDNIPGIKGLGPKKVYDLLQFEDDEHNACNLVLNFYERQYKEYATEAIREVANLLWICRSQQETGEQYLENKGFI